MNRRPKAYIGRMAKSARKPPHPRPPPSRARVQKGDHVFLVDGSSYIFRAYHALPPLNRKSDGLQVNAVLGFCNMLWKLLRDMKPEDKPTHLAVIFDKSESTFRNEMYADYKAHRPAAPEDLIPQFPLIREATRAFDIPCLEMLGFEADDLIATYARQACAEGERHHRVVRQGPDAARERLRHDVRHDEGQEDRHRGGVPDAKGKAAIRISSVAVSKFMS